MWGSNWADTVRPQVNWNDPNWGGQVFVAQGGGVDSEPMEDQ